MTAVAIYHIRTQSRHERARLFCKILLPFMILHTCFDIMQVQKKLIP